MSISFRVTVCILRKDSCGFGLILASVPLNPQNNVETFICLGHPLIPQGNVDD
mgnify:FL=1